MRGVGTLSQGKGHDWASLESGRMKTSTIVALIGVCAALASAPALSATSTATPAPAPTAAPPMSASERQFVGSVTKDLQSRFATQAAATAAGYFRYTDEDDTGAISWVNTKYWASDQQHPSQLWYDVNGRLIGADWSVLQTTSPKAPTVWGISASRWLDFSPAHVHFGVKTPSGVQYGAAGSKTWSKIGSLEHPTSAEVVKLATMPRWKVLKIPAPETPDDVAFVFEFPALWDLQVWLVPNPLGAFAEHNPNVTPSAAAKHQD